MTFDLVPLELIEGLDAPCRRHPAEPALVDTDDVRFAAMASRAFPESDLATVILFGHWLTWLARLDDECATASSDSLDERYDLLLSIVDGEHSDDVFAGLWHRTAWRVGPGWRRRFRRELEEHRRGVLHEAANRKLGRVPMLGEYERLRRLTNGSLLLLLPEAMLRVEVPAEVLETLAWRELVDSCNDITAWCNDLASLPKESACGDPHNYVLVLSHALGIPHDTAEAKVLARIADRMTEMRAAARCLPSTFDSLGIGRRQACDLSRVAVTLLGAPRGHLEWLRETARYRP